MSAGPDRIREINARQPAYDLNQESLLALIDGEIPAIPIGNVETADECTAFCEAIRQHGHQAIEAQTTRIRPERAT